MRRWIGVGVTTAMACVVSMSPSAGADPVPTGSPTCHGQVVTVTDIAAPTVAMNGLADRLRRTGSCVTTLAWGVTPLAQRAHSAGAPLLGGLSSLSRGAADLDDLMGSDDLATGPVTVVAHGAGGLLAQYARLHGRHGSRIATVITLGPVWRGTDIGGIAQVEALSRRIGTYDAVLAAEKPVVDPVCAGCREIVGGSDFLTGLTRDGLRSRGVRYVDIISLDDGLVSDPVSAAIPGSTVRTVRGPAFHHFTLPADRLVGALVTSSVHR